MALRSLPRRRLSEEVAAVLRKGILNGSFGGGMRIIEARVAGELGVSKAPVREALAHLAAEGLVEVIPRRGTYVVKISEIDYWEICTMRGVLEGFAAEIAAHTLDEEHLKQLEEIVQRMEASSDAEERSEAHLCFHKVLVELSRHSRLSEAWLALEGQIRLSLTMNEYFYTQPLNIGTAHRPILEALRQQNGELCRKLVVQQAEPQLEALRAIRRSQKRSGDDGMA